MAESGAFEALVDELGVESPQDLGDLDESDLHNSASLPPMLRLDLVACLCNSEFASIAEALCGGQEL